MMSASAHPRFSFATAGSLASWTAWQATSFVYPPMRCRAGGKIDAVPAPRWTVIVPVKQTAIAKSRLVELGDSARRRLATAFALDAVGAALGCPEVAAVVVVTNDEPVGRLLSGQGADVVPDRPDAGLNAALDSTAAATRRRHPDADIVAMSADLPAARSADISAVLSSAPPRRWFVPDRAARGTSMLGAPAPDRLAPAFGTHSRAAHAASGAVEIRGRQLERVRLDVDTVEDLRVAVGLGVGAATAAVLTAIGWETRPDPAKRKAV